MGTPRDPIYDHFCVLCQPSNSQYSKKWSIWGLQIPGGISSFFTSNFHSNAVGIMSGDPFLTRVMTIFINMNILEICIYIYILIYIQGKGGRKEGRKGGRKEGRKEKRHIWGYSWEGLKFIHITCDYSWETWHLEKSGMVIDGSVEINEQQLVISRCVLNSVGANTVVFAMVFFRNASFANKKSQFWGLPVMPSFPGGTQLGTTMRLVGWSDQDG